MKQMKKIVSLLLFTLIIYNLGSTTIKNTSGEPMNDINVLTIIHPEVVPGEFTDVISNFLRLGANITYTGFVDSVLLGGQTFYKDISVSEVNAEDYDIFFMAGGWAARRIVESEHLNETNALIQDLYNANVLMTSVCAGATLFVFADIINGTSLTAYAELAPEIETAGGTYVDSIVVVDEPFVTVQGLYQVYLIPAIAEVLGLFEDVPPTCVDASFAFMGDNKYNITIEATDDSFVLDVLLFIYKISETNQSQFIQGVQLGKTCDFIFSGVVSLDQDCLYSFDVSMTDGYSNNGVESDVLRIDTHPTSSTNINFMLITLSLISLSIVLLLSQKRRSF